MNWVSHIRKVAIDKLIDKFIDNKVTKLHTYSLQLSKPIR